MGIIEVINEAVKVLQNKVDKIENDMRSPEHVNVKGMLTSHDRRISNVWNEFDRRCGELHKNSQASAAAIQSLDIRHGQLAEEMKRIHMRIDEINTLLNPPLFAEGAKIGETLRIKMPDGRSFRGEPMPFSLGDKVLFCDEIAEVRGVISKKNGERRVVVEFDNGATVVYEERLLTAVNNK